VRALVRGLPAPGLRRWSCLSACSRWLCCASCSTWGGDAEVLDPWFAADAIDAGFDFSFQAGVTGFLLGRGRTVAFDRYLQSRERVRSGFLLTHFLSSHDVSGALQLLGGDRDRFRLAALLQFTASGLPVVYYGKEVARAGGGWPENRTDMPWGIARFFREPACPATRRSAPTTAG
jgi:Alpha amylase, catalytic domain